MFKSPINDQLLLGRRRTSLATLRRKKFDTDEGPGRAVHQLLTGYTYGQIGVEGSGAGECAHPVSITFQFADSVAELPSTKGIRCILESAKQHRPVSILILYDHVPYDVKLVNTRDGRVLAADSGSLRLEPRWLKAALNFHPNGGEPNAYFKGGDLLREDGRYSIRFTIDNKQYGEYPFVVKGGRIELQGK